MRYLLCSLLLASTGLAFAATKVYQWTDEEGVVHFSNQPPPQEIQAQTRNVEPIQKPGSVAPKAPSPRQSKPAADQSAVAAADTADPELEERLRRERCEQGRQWVAAIEPADRIQVKRPDGSNEWLYGEERLAELERARQMVAENCP